MKIKPNYIIIPLITMLTASLGSWVTANGMDWYKTINLPSWTPPGSFIGTVWTTIFILATISALIVWNKPERYKNKNKKRYKSIVGLFFANAFLNFFWSYLFFGLHFLATAVVQASLLGSSVVGLIYLIWPVSKKASVLLIPYALWVSFATYLTYVVWQMNIAL